MVVIGVTNRGGFLSFIVILIPVYVLIWKQRIFWTLGPILSIIFVLFFFSGIAFKTTNSSREISGAQLISNVQSIFTGSNDDELNSTKEWRTNWWNSILANNGPGGAYALSGQGYGINLADEYGYQVLADGSLRSPHSAWFNFLARGGIPGIATVIILMLANLSYIFRKLQQSEDDTRSIITWGLFGIVGIMINASLDVYLENPIGGVLFWSLLGVILACCYISTQVDVDPKSKIYNGTNQIMLDDISIKHKV